MHEFTYFLSLFADGLPGFEWAGHHCRRVEVEIDLGIGDGSAVVLGSDLTHEYVTVNADYRS